MGLLRTHPKHKRKRANMKLQKKTGFAWGGERTWAVRMVHTASLFPLWKVCHHWHKSWWQHWLMMLLIHSNLKITKQCCFNQLKLGNLLHVESLTSWRNIFKNPVCEYIIFSRTFYQLCMRKKQGIMGFISVVQQCKNSTSSPMILCCLSDHEVWFDWYFCSQYIM